MRINRLNPQPIARFPFLNAGRRANDFFVDQLPVYLAHVEGIPESVEAIIATADLQGLEATPQKPGQPTEHPNRYSIDVDSSVSLPSNGEYFKSRTLLWPIEYSTLLQLILLTSETQTVAAK